MEKLLFEAVSPRINSSKFGLVSAQELFQFELTCSEIYTRADIIQETEFNFNQKLHRSKRQDVMYVNVGGPPADNACPSIADSSAVSLAQMAFLAMTVSIFTVVATVANNINSNNNNVNENNLNFVQQKENSLSMNQNIVNQINVDLPPPVPGKRSVSTDKTLSSYQQSYTGSTSDVARENQIKAAVAQKKYKAQTASASAEAESEAAKAMLEVLSLQYWNYMLLPANQKECIGRELCLRSLRVSSSSNTSTLSYKQQVVHRVFYLMESFALLYLQLEDHSETFAQFMQTMTQRKQTPAKEQDCFELFPNCGTEELYVLKVEEKK